MTDPIFEQFADTSPGILYIFDESGVICDVIAPQRLTDQLFRPVEELCNRPVTSVLPADLAEQFLAEIRATLESDEAQSFEYTLGVPAGHRHFEAHLTPIAHDTWGDGAVVATVLDITRHKEQVLRTYDRLDFVSFCLDRELTVTFANRAATERFEISNRNICGEKVSDVLPASVVSRLKQACTEVLATRESQSLEVYYEEYGTYAEVRIYPKDDGLSIVSWDITEQKVTEQRLQTELRKFRSILETVPAVIYRVDIDTMEPAVVNDAVEDVFGYSPTEWIVNADLWRESIHADDTNRVESFITSLWEDREPGEIDYRIETKDGDVRWVRDRLRWERDELGDIISLLRIITDITESKRKQRQYSTFVNNLPGIVIRSSVTPSELPEYVHGKCEQLTGYSCGNIAGRVGHVRSLVHPDDKDSMLETVDRAARDGGSYEVSYRIVTRDGSTKWLSEFGDAVEDNVIEAIILEGDRTAENT